MAKRVLIYEVNKEEGFTTLFCSVDGGPVSVAYTTDIKALRKTYAPVFLRSRAWADKQEEKAAQAERLKEMGLSPIEQKPATREYYRHSYNG